MVLQRGSIAYNPKDLEPWGYIDAIITNTPLDEMPKGSYGISWPVGTFITSWGQELPAAEFFFRAVPQDIPATQSSVTYISILTFIYYDIDGVEVERRTRTVRFVIQYAYDTPDEDLPQNSLNTYYLFLDRESRIRVEFEVIGTLQLAPDSELASRIAGLQYDDTPVFGRNNIRQLPSDQLGMALSWSESTPMPQAGSTVGLSFGIFGGMGFPDIMGAGVATGHKIKWVFQIINAKTIVNRKITITQSMIDTPRISGSIPIQIVGDEEGITRVLCARDEPLDLNEDELANLGIDFPEAINNGVDGNRAVMNMYNDSALWNKSLKQIYRSDFTEHQVILHGGQGIHGGSKIQSSIHNSEYDLMANTILIDPVDDNGEEIEAGHEIYVTYGHVYDFMLRQIVEVKQTFSSVFIAGVPFSYGAGQSPVDVYSYLPSSYWVSVEDTDTYIYDDINWENREQSEGDFTGIIVVDPNEKFLPKATWATYIEDKEKIKQAAEDEIPSNEVQVGLVKVFGQRLTNSMRDINDISGYSMVTDYPAFPNGLIVGSYSYDGGKPGGILWINVFSLNVRVLVPRDEIRDQDWFYEWFYDNINLGSRNNSHGSSPSDLWVGSEFGPTNDVFFDQNIFVNSFINDNNKVAYEGYTAEALKNCSKFNPLDDTNTTGIGVSNFDFFEPGTTDSRVPGLPGIESEYYSDASSATFITPPRISPEPKVWEPITMSVAGVGAGSAGLSSQVAQYTKFHPLQLNNSGRVYFEKKPSSDTNVLIWTRAITSAANNATVNHGRTRGIYASPDLEGVHSRLHTTDKDILNDVYSMELINSGFSHTILVQDVSYRLYSYRENSEAELNYTKGIRVVPSADTVSIDLKKPLTKGFNEFELILPGYAERLILYYDIDDSKLKEAEIYLLIIGESDDEYIDVKNLTSSGYIDIYLGYLTGTVYISSNVHDSISSMSASIHWISEGEFDRISGTCISCSPIIDSVGNYNIFELISKTSKTNLSVLRSGSGKGPYFMFPYLFLTFDSEEILGMIVKSDYSNKVAYIFFTINGSLLMKKVIFSDLDISQASNIDLNFLNNGIDGSAFVNTGTEGQEGQLLSYNYFLELFNDCHQAARLYFEPAYLVQSNVADNLWIENELLSSSVYAAYEGSVSFESYDLSDLDGTDQYTSRVVASDGLIRAYLDDDTDFFNKSGYTVPVDGSFTVEILSNGSMIVLYTHEGKVYGRVKSEDKEWVSLFNVDNKVLGFQPVRVSKLSAQEVGLPESTDMDSIGLADLDESDVDMDLSNDSLDVNSISSCYDSKSDNLYLFYNLDGFCAFHKIRGTSISKSVGVGIFYQLDSTTPRAILSSKEDDMPIFLVGEVSDELFDAISVEGNNYLQFKYPIESIPDFQGDEMLIQGSPASSFTLSDGIVRFMYIDSYESLRGGIIAGSQPQLDVQLRDKND
ncbi:hypothetical protein CL614_02995 [archaeon]|jgi:hypothetical protein|nr:hypothetical protein [archaeon]|tara:strand:- start:1387 stop:5691 length:4305 start_codon:yes stop_codon:yes gene_type:complete